VGRISQGLWAQVTAVSWFGNLTPELSGLLSGHCPSKRPSRRSWLSTVVASCPTVPARVATVETSRSTRSVMASKRCVEESTRPDMASNRCVMASNRSSCRIAIAASCASCSSIFLTAALCCSDSARMLSCNRPSAAQTSSKLSNAMPALSPASRIVHQL